MTATRPTPPLAPQSGGEVFVACPGYHATGGTELAHQLAYHLRVAGTPARMLYVDNRRWSASSGTTPVHPELAGYAIPYVLLLEDDPRHVLVVPESDTPRLSQYRRVRKAIWWMSVDNYVASIPHSGPVKAVARHVLWFTGWRARPFLFGLDRHKPLIHCYQSEYARRYLVERGIPAERIWPLGDYLHGSFLASRPAARTDREDIILYNPSKGNLFTQELINNAPDLKFVPLQGLNRAEVISLLGKAKLYIDFGHHPGKDRIPREACIMGACIITNRRGAAANDIDVAIPDDYKFDDTQSNITKILCRIREIMQDFDYHSGRFEPYRDIIRGEPQFFINQVMEIFG